MSTTQSTTVADTNPVASPAPSEFKDDKPEKRDPKAGHSERLRKAKDKATQETIEKQNALSHAKGRAQITATSAMFMANVTLLKSVISEGPEFNRFYHLSLTLISLSLILQVLAGIMTLAVERTLSYVMKTGESESEDCKESCCPRRFMRRNDPNSETDVSEVVKPSGELAMAKESDWDISYENSDDGITREEHGPPPLCPFCPIKCSSEVYGSYETYALEKFLKWEKRSIDNDLKAVRVEEEIGYFQHVIDKTKQKIAGLRVMKEGQSKPPSPKDVERQIKDLQAVLKSVEAEKEEHESIQRKTEIFGEQGLLIKELAEAVRKQRVVRHASFWQSVLNYIFYAIFTLNAFITGFGIASSAPASASTTQNASAM